MTIQLDMIGLTVHDMAASLAFYRLLGLAVADPAPGEPYVDVITPNGYRVSWNSVEMMKSLDPNWVEPAGQSLTLAFKCDSPAEVNAVFARLTGAGYGARRAPWDAEWGMRYAVVLDPDGNGVDLFAPLPKS